MGQAAVTAGARRHLPAASQGTASDVVAVLSDEEIVPEQVSEKHHPRVAYWWARIQARPAFGRAQIGPFVTTTS